MTCKGICERHKVPKPYYGPGEGGGGGRYSAGQKRCTMCELFIKWDGLWCHVAAVDSGQTLRTQKIEEE